MRRLTSLGLGKLFLLSCMLVASLGMTPASGQTSPPPLPDETWRRAERELGYEQDAMGFQFESTSKTDPLEEGDAIHVKFRMDAAELSYEFVSFTPEEHTRIQFQIVFEALAEYRDRNEDGRYGPGDDLIQRIEIPQSSDATSIVQRHLSSSYLATTRFPLSSSSNGEPSPLPIGNDGRPPSGTLNLQFLMTSQTLLENGIWVTPTDVKLDLLIEAFPYHQNDTQLALETRLETFFPITSEPGELRIQADETLRGFYRWTGWSRGPTEERPVEVTLKEEPPSNGTTSDVSARSVLFSYPHDTQTVQGPLVGIFRFQTESAEAAILPNLPGDGRMYSLGILLSGLVVGITMVLRLRRSQS